MQALENFFNQLLVNIQIYYDTATTGVSTLTLGKTLALIGASIGMSLLVTLVYLLVNRKRAYSTKSLFTILLMGPIVSVIVIAVGSNLARAISIGGGLALIRFRHSVENPSDLIFIYLSAAVGMACGTGGIGFALIAIGIILAVILIASLTKFDSIGGGAMRLTIMIPESLDFAGVFEPVLKFLTFILTNAAPLPGLTCENSSTVYILSSKRIVIPFLISFTLNMHYLLYYLASL